MAAKVTELLKTQKFPDNFNFLSTSENKKKFGNRGFGEIENFSAVINKKQSRRRNLITIIRLGSGFFLHFWIEEVGFDFGSRFVGKKPMKSEFN